MSYTRKETRYARSLVARVALHDKKTACSYDCLLLLLFYFCSAGLPWVAEVFSRVQRLSSSEMLRGRSEADTSPNLKPRLNTVKFRK